MIVDLFSDESGSLEIIDDSNFRGGKNNPSMEERIDQMFADTNSAGGSYSDGSMPPHYDSSDNISFREDTLNDLF